MAQGLPYSALQIDNMNNLDFFKAGWVNEKNTTLETIRSISIDPIEPGAKIECKSHRELVTRMLTHLKDMETILTEDFCEETQTYFFTDQYEAAAEASDIWDRVMRLLNQCCLNDWEDQQVQLHVEGEPIVTLTRTSMVWFFYFDIMYLRGKLASAAVPVYA